MRHCSNQECPHRLAVGAAAEFVDDARTVCSDCGADLLAGAAPRPEDALPPVGSALRARAWITIGVPMAVVLVGLLVPVPGLHVEVPALRGIAAVRTPHLLDLGITHFLAAAVICEVVRWVWPSWRPRSAAARARAPIGMAAVVLGGLAGAALAWQGGALAVQANMSTVPAWNVALTLVAGSALALGAATLVTRRGLAPGLALIPACIVLPFVLDALGQAWSGDLPLRAGALPMVAMAASALVTWWATVTHRRLRGPIDPPVPADDGGAPGAAASPDAAAAPDANASPGAAASPDANAAPDARRPARGQDVVIAARMPVVRLPLSAFPVLLLPLLFEQLRYAAFQLRLTTAFEGGFGAPVMRWVVLGLLAVVALLADGAVVRPARAAEAWARAAGDGRASVYEDWLRAVRKAASVRSLGWAAALVTLSLTCQVGLWSLLLAAMATTAAVDARAEWRARRAEPTLITIAHEDDPATADAVLFALRRAGIEGHVRALRTRALLRFTGPFVPMAVMVPRARGDEARALVASVQASATEEGSHPGVAARA